MEQDYRKKKYLNRKEFLGAKDNKDAYHEENLSPFSKRALTGLSYLKDGEDTNDILNRLDKKIDQASGKQQGSFFSIGRIIGLAASILLLAMAVFLFSNTQSDQKLFTSYFEPMPSAVANTGVSRGEAAAANPKATAFEAYEAGDFQKAIPNFRTYLERNPQDKESRFYFGLALLGDGYSNEAIEILKEVNLQPPKPGYKDASSWYLALAYLQLEQRQDAESILSTLEQGNSNYSNIAKQLLEDLR